MCGVIAVRSPSQTINAMHIQEGLRNIAHRGPDHIGLISRDNDRVFLGHTLLAIADSEKNSRQPMESDGWTLIYNGEIYNTSEVKADLKSFGIKVTSSSDTELFLKAVKAFGFEYLNKVHGCYAFVIYDDSSRSLFFGRDPFGEKQLVWTMLSNGNLAISSETKAFSAFPEFSYEPNDTRVWSDFIFGFFSARNETYFKKVYNSEPGQIYRCNELGKILKHVTVKRIDDVEYSDSALRDALTESIIQQVPNRYDPAVVLSGGLDSSIIACILRQTHSCITAFTAYYPGCNNSDYETAKKLINDIKNIQHVAIKVSQEDSYPIIDKVTYALEEPMLDQVYLTQYMIYREIADRGFRVALNGQASDEFWFGYYRHYDFQTQLDYIARGDWHRYYYNRAIDKGLGDFIDSSEIRNIIECNLSHFEENDPHRKLTSFAVRNHLQAMLAHEDRLSMASSVEVRLPFLDRTVASLAFATPCNQKYSETSEKLPLRRSFSGIVPEYIVERPKQAFPDAPISHYRSMEDNFGSALIGGDFFSNAAIKKFSADGRSTWHLHAINKFSELF